MSSTSESGHEPARRHGGRCGGVWGGKAHWSGLNIAGMVLGFILFWPIGLFMLYWIMTGRQVHELPRAIREQWASWTGRETALGSAGADNVIFNEYQQTQYDRIHEIKQEIKERGRRFQQFRSEARRRADQEEFNQFMSDAGARAD
ncbi:MAG: DUF2852 domain-containing protein [Gammaproteobacteria bacterium]|nr:DUF2852 domain-containing protein [Gammaproteobacteria bacterium]